MKVKATHRFPVRSNRHLWELVPHLTRRELQSAHRFTVLGWSWPVVRQLAQLGVLVFIFSNVLDLGIENYALFVFTGLIVWSAFAAGLLAATTSVVKGRHLAMTPGFPTAALPLVAAAAALVDLLLALPVLVAMLVYEGLLDVTALLLPAALLLQFGLTAGIGLVVSAGQVVWRDVANIVAVVLLLLFYLTPVFYGLRNIPDDVRWTLEVNPMTAQVEITRALLIEGRLPDQGDVVMLVLVVPALLAIGWWVFRRLEPRFVDEL